MRKSRSFEEISRRVLTPDPPPARMVVRRGETGLMARNAGRRRGLVSSPERIRDFWKFRCLRKWAGPHRFGHYVPGRSTLRESVGSIQRRFRITDLRISVQPIRAD